MLVLLRALILRNRMAQTDKDETISKLGGLTHSLRRW